MKFTLRIAAILLACAIFGANDARAMAILDFARMNLEDQATYITSLVEGSAKMLRTSGHTDQAQKLVDLFKNSTKQGGIHQLAINLKNLQLQNTRNGDNPNNRIPDADVEAAMALTLRDNGITVPAGFLLTINRNFQPQFPPRAHADLP